MAAPCLPRRQFHQRLIPKRILHRAERTLIASQYETVDAVTFDLRWRAACGLPVTAAGFHRRP